MYTDVHSIGRARVNDRKVYLYTQRHGGEGGGGRDRDPGDRCRVCEEE